MFFTSFKYPTYHLYDIKYKNKTYDCWPAEEGCSDYEKIINDVTTKSSDILKMNNQMKMKCNISSIRI